MSAIHFQQALRLPAGLLMPLYLGLHLLLDWATFIPSFSPLGITPWNPTTGLALGLVLLKGPLYAPLLAVAPLASDLIVRQVPLPLATTFAEVVLTGLSYAAGVLCLRRTRPPFDIALQGMRDLLLLGIVATISAALVAVLCVGVLVTAGLLPAAEFAVSALRYWIGETIGIMVMTPFVLLLFTTHRAMRITREGMLQTLAILAAIALVLGLGSRYHTQLFYVLFLPIVWIAVRHALEGVSIALVLMQVGIMVTLHLGRQEAIEVTEFQAVMLVLVGAGLTIGMLVRERQSDEARLRRQQEHIARATRLASLDRFNMAMAHEINQPLTAIGNYAQAAVRALDRAPADAAAARDAAGKALEQVKRAGEVVRRLRDLITLGRADLAPQSLTHMIEESIALMQPDLSREGVRVALEIERGCPDRVMADLIQIEQVLTNLLRNAVEAMRERPKGSRFVSIAAEAGAGGDIIVRIADTGPGFPAGFRLAAGMPGASTKPDGLGIGLTLCATIIEAHGGRLTVSEPGMPATVTFTIKVASGGGNGSHC